MNVENFLANFGHIANAPEGINRLRAMIYNLALTGHLIEQRRDEGDGQALLEEIERKKQQLINTGHYKRSPTIENLPRASNEKLPKIPGTWTWTRLVEIGEISPRNETDDSTIVSFASMNSIPEKHSSKVAAEDRPWSTVKKGYTHFADGDVVLAKITPCFENGKAAVMTKLTNGIGAGTTELHVVRPIARTIEPGFIYVFLRSPYFKIAGEAHMTGTAGQKRLPTEYFATRPFPLPPRKEQKRIVAKVDELMALTDRLEAQQRERDRYIPALSHTCHVRFIEAPIPAHLNLIFDEASSVSPVDLRKTILTLATRGTLTRRDPSDEPVPPRFNVRSGALDFDERVFSKALASLKIPPSWSVQPLARVSSIVDCPHTTPKWTERGKICVRTNQFRPGHLDLSDVRYVSEETYTARIQRLKPRQDDILYSREGGILGVACRVPPNTELCLGQRMILIRAGEWAEPAFLEMVLNSPLITTIALTETTGAAAPRVNVSTVRAYPIPLPPIPEQRRIVTRVDELLSLINRLENQQRERAKLAEAFAKACVATFTGTKNIENREKMKAPKTELVSVVRISKRPKPNDEAPLASLLSRYKGELPAKALWQHSGLAIDAFYQQLKTEIVRGWVELPMEAEMKVVE